MHEPPLKPHDLAGLLHDPLSIEEKDHALWEKRVDAMIMLLQHPDRGLISTDEVRRAVEGLGPEAYATMTYYERWVAAIAQIMLEKGVVTSEELGAGIERILKTPDVLP